ncbi:MAG TPA: alkaline phosphatase D family protein [Candidatus Binatia bacterium]
MRFSRREFLKLAAQAGIAAPFVFNASGCAVLKHDSFDDETGLSLGYVAGDTTSDSAVIWLRAEPGSAVSIDYAKNPALTASASTPPASVSAASDYTAQIPLRGLDSGTVYYYRAVIAGKRPGPVVRFKTAPRPEDAAVVKFCFSGDTRESYKPFTIMDAIGSMRPDFFVHLGDTIYADRGGTASRLEEFWAKYRANRDDAPSRRLCSQTSFYVMWDDHEVRDNYGPENPLAAVGQRAFLDYWPVRHDSGDATRIYRSFRWGKALEIFLLDSRQYRDHKRGSMLGAQQKDWLLDAIASSSATFKVIATSVPMYGGGDDRWDGFPTERKEIFHWIRDRKITGVTFIAADLHFASVAQVSRHPPTKEIVVGPMAAPLNSLGIGYSTGMDFFSNKAFNYGMITVDPKSTPPRMLVEIRDDANGLLYKTEIDGAY